MKTEISLTGNELLEEMRSVMRREKAPPAISSDSLSKVLAPESVELLRLLSGYSPPSVSDLAKKLGRSQSNVSRTLTLLARHGFVRMVRCGRQSRPEVVAPRMQIQYDLATGAFRAQPAAA